MEKDYLIKKALLLHAIDHETVRFVFNDAFTKTTHNNRLSGLCSGKGFFFEVGGVTFTRNPVKELSPHSVVVFYDYCNFDYQHPLDQATLNMEEFYYFLELSYYLLLQKRYETKESFAWYLDELAKFRQTCAIKDIYGERLQHFREEYGVTIEA